MNPLFLCLTISLFVTLGSSSTGDQLLEFKQCVNSCISSECPSDLPLSLRLTLWTCESNCDYKCQKTITQIRIKQKLPTVQFHGKWPFNRWWGIQEPASVLFSLLNLWPHLQGFNRISRLSRQSSTSNPLIPYYLGFAAVGINAWVWSAVFHTRDFLITERLDYFAAACTIFYGFFTACVRIFRLDDESKKLHRNTLIVVCLTAYFSHVFYLSFITFSYSYNMLANVVVGLSQNILWIYHSIESYRKDQGNSSRSSTFIPWTLWPAIIVLLITVAMGFELFDFAPWLYIIDAHSLWHAGTVVPTYLWYSWMIRDLGYLQLSKKQDKL